MSPQMSHREEVLCKMTPRIRITVSLHMVPEHSSSHDGLYESDLGERLSLLNPKSFRIKPVSFHYFSALGEEKPLSLDTFPEPISQ